MRSISGIFSLLFFAHICHAADIGVIGLFPGKAVLVIDNASPKTYSAGSKITENLKLVSVNETSATFEENGKRVNIAIGEHANRTDPTGSAKTILQADGQGHFIAQGQINGGTITLLVDTGATMIALSASDATRLGINYKRGQVGRISTANGSVPVYRVMLDSVKIGDIQLTQVAAVVQEQGLPFALLGMSFLNRTDMQRSGEQMTLTKRY